MGCNRRIRRVPVGLGLVCGRRAKEEEEKRKREEKRSSQKQEGKKNRENGGMHATKMAAHCVHSMEGDRGYETGMEAAVEWG